MSVQAMALAWKLQTGSATMKAVLVAVANYADEEGVCWPSQEQLSADTELSRHTIMRAMDALEELGLLSRERRHRGDGSRTSDLIMLDLSSMEQRSAEQRSNQQRSTVQQPKSHGATARTTIEPSKVSIPRVSEPPSEEKLAFEAWNDLAQDLSLAKAQQLTPERKSKLKARLAECGGLDGWLVAMGKIRGSPFLRGDSGDWRATLDFVLQKSSFMKLMEGAYDDRPGQKRASANRGASLRDAFAALDAVADAAVSRAGGLRPEDHEAPLGDVPRLRESNG